MKSKETKEKYKKFVRKPCSESAKRTLSEKGKKRWADNYEKTLDECMNPIIRQKMTKTKQSPENRLKQSKANKLRMQDPIERKKWIEATHNLEVNEKKKEISLKLWQTEEYKNKQMKIMESEEFKQKRKEIYTSEKFLNNHSKVMIEMWKDPKKHKKSSDSSKKYLQSLTQEKYEKRIKTMALARHIRPNKPEQFVNNLLQEMFPNNYKYVGDFSFVIGGKNPDFMNCNGQKKLIEFFGVHWHPAEDEEIRINHFKQYGFDTLIIWEKELNKHNLDNLKIKLTEFHNRGHL
jgi:hypothetical protein